MSEYVKWIRNGTLGATEVYCHGTKKNGIPCKRYLGKVEGKAELLCPICKTVNVVENGKVDIKEKTCGKKN
jgi:phage FluMu protein Com